MHTFVEINKIHQLDEYRDCWAELLVQTPGATFFQSLAWLETYWRHFGSNQKLRVLIVKQQSRVVGIVPLVVRRETKFVAGQCRKLTYPLNDWGSFYGPIGPDPKLLLGVALKHIRSARRDWDLIDLGWTNDRDDVIETALQLQALGISAKSQIQDETAIVDHRGTWEEYLASRTSKWRNNFKRWRKRLSEQGEVRHVRYRPEAAYAGGGDPRWDLYTVCEQIAENSWQGSSTDGTTLSHESVRAFLRDVHAVAANQGAADINLLYVDDEPVAFEYGYHYNGSVFGLRIGAEGPHARLGAGNLLYAMIIEDNFARGDHLFDLGPGSLDIKRHLMTRVVPIRRYTHYHPVAPGANLVRAKRWIEELRQSWATPTA